MCLGIPAKVINIDDSKMGKVEYRGTKVNINFVLLEEVKVGDWVIIHAGYAISSLNEEEANESIKLINEFLEASAKTLKNQ